MSELPQPEIIFTHEGDLDGFVAGCLLQRLAELKFGLSIKVEPLSANPWPGLKRFPKQAWVSDLSFDPKIDRSGWMIVDHHTTESTPRSANLIHNVSHSASKLCYQLLLKEGGGNDRLNRLVELTDIADLYLSDHPEFDVASDYARLVKTYHFRSLYRLIGSDLERLVDHPLLALMKQKRLVEDPIGLEWSRQNIHEVTDRVGYVATSIGDTNYIVHQLLNDPEQKYEALITFFKKPSGPVTASIRSQNGEALGLAKKLQGGGHPNAAGTTLPRSVTTFEGAVAYLGQVLAPVKGRETEKATGTEALFESAGF